MKLKRNMFTLHQFQLNIPGKLDHSPKIGIYSKTFAHKLKICARLKLDIKHLKFG